MLEGGADIRYIQQTLGHAELSTTQIYTQVSIRALKAIHTATHPGATNQPRHSADHDEDPKRTDATEELLDTLDAEAIAEHDDGEHDDDQHGHLDDDRPTEPDPTARRRPAASTNTRPAPAHRPSHRSTEPAADPPSASQPQPETGPVPE